MKTILVTGGAGFIGSNFVGYLYEKYPTYRIVVLDALTYAGSIENLPSGSFDDRRFQFWYGNVTNAEMVDTLVGQADAVVHFAAETHVTRSIFGNLQFFETDVIGTQTIANAVLKYKNRIDRFIHISTSEVYGTAESALMDEGHPLNPLSPYAAAKCGADRLVYSYHATYNIPSVIVRPFNMFGPRQHLEKVIPRFVTSCILGEPMTVHGDGSAIRDFMYVTDLCRGLDLLLHADREKVAGHTVNFGTGRGVSVGEIAESVARLMGQASPDVARVGNRPGQVDRHTCDNRKANELLGWSPEVTFEEGLAKTVAWYRENPQAWANQKWLRHVPIVTADGVREMH